MSLPDILNLVQTDRTSNHFRNEILKSWAYARFPAGSENRTAFNEMIQSGVIRINDVVKLDEQQQLLDILQTHSDQFLKTYYELIQDDGILIGGSGPWREQLRETLCDQHNLLNEKTRNQIIQRGLQNCIIQFQPERLLERFSKEKSIIAWKTSPLYLFYKLFIRQFGEFHCPSHETYMTILGNLDLSEKTVNYITDLCYEQTIIQDIEKQMIEVNSLHLYHKDTLLSLSGHQLDTYFNIADFE